MDINEYLNLPSYEHLMKPKFMGLLEAVLNPAVGLGIANDSLGSAFDIRNAAGNQLDIIGELVGLSRLLPYVPATGDREMDDDEYRLALNLKIARNEWDGTNESAIRIYGEYISGFSVKYQDNQDMTISITIVGMPTTREVEILSAANLLMVPDGVSATIYAQTDTVSLELYYGAGISGTQISYSVGVHDDVSYNVELIEDMSVSNVEDMYVRKLQE